MTFNKEWFEGPKSRKRYQESEEKEETIIVSSCVRTCTSADRTRHKKIKGPKRGIDIKTDPYNSGLYDDLEKILHRVLRRGKGDRPQENCSCKSEKFPGAKYDDFKLPVKVPIIFAVKHPGLIYDKSVTTKRKEAFRKIRDF